MDPKQLETEYQNVLQDLDTLLNQLGNEQLRPLFDEPFDETSNDTDNTHTQQTHQNLPDKPQQLAQPICQELSVQSDIPSDDIHEQLEQPIFHEPFDEFDTSTDNTHKQLTQPLYHEVSDEFTTNTIKTFTPKQHKKQPHKQRKVLHRPNKPKLIKYKQYYISRPEYTITRQVTPLDYTNRHFRKKPLDKE